MGEKSHHKMIEFLKKLSSRIRKPDEILVISAHWEESVPTLIDPNVHELFYDYYGFPAEAYKIKYPVTGNNTLVKLIQEQLKNKKIDSRIDNKRGIDHGVFIPLILMYPDGDIPVTQLSLIKGLNPGDHILLGEALQSLLTRNILIIGSGFSFHNLGMFSTDMNDVNDKLNNEFQDWLIDVCSKTADLKSRTNALEEWENAPYARYCHPREEHLLPLHVCASIAAVRANVIFDDYIIGKRSVAFEW